MREVRQYEWRFSHHIEFSRISSTVSSTLKISDVKFEDEWGCCDMSSRC